MTEGTNQEKTMTPEKITKLRINLTLQTNKKDHSRRFKNIQELIEYTWTHRKTLEKMGVRGVTDNWYLGLVWFLLKLRAKRSKGELWP